MEIRRSSDRLISTKGFPLLIRWHLYIESRPRAHKSFVKWVPGLGHLVMFTGMQHESVWRRSVLLQSFLLGILLASWPLLMQGSYFWMRPSNERRRYNVTSSLIGLAHAQNNPCWCDMPLELCLHHGHNAEWHHDLWIMLNMISCLLQLSWCIYCCCTSWSYD